MGRFFDDMGAIAPYVIKSQHPSDPSLDPRSPKYQDFMTY